MSRLPISFVEKDAPAYVDLLPYVAVDPECGAVLLAANAWGAPDELGFVWRIAPVETETRSNDELGAIASRVDNVLRNVPEESSCQFLLRASSNVRPLLEAWDRAGRTKDPIVEMISGSRQTAIDGLSIPSEGGVFTARSFHALFTIRRAGSWPSLRVAPAEAALSLFGSAAIPERVRKCYAEDRRRMTELARTVESLFVQAGVACERLGEEALAGELYETLNPHSARYRSCPKAAGGERLAERVAQSPLEVDFFRGLVTLDWRSHMVVSVTQFPGETTAGMLARGAGAAVLAAAPECDLVLAFHVPKQDELVARFKRECLLPAHRGDPHIVRIDDLGEDGNQIYSVMEYVAGRS